MNQDNGAGLNHSEITRMVISSLEEVLALGGDDRPRIATIGKDTRLFGREAVLDSMGLVTLIVELEQLLEEEYDVTVILADDRAMSMEHSPFRSVASLADYIGQLVEEQG